MVSLLDVNRTIKQVMALPTRLDGVTPGEYTVACRARRWLREQGVKPRTQVTLEQATDAVTCVLRDNVCPPKTDPSAG